MIRINLLSEGGGEAAAQPRPGPLPLNLSPVVLVGLSALLSFAVVGGLGGYWNHRIGQLEQQMGREQAEQARLAAVQKQNQLYQKQVQELEHRLQTIQVLEQSRTGPVELMTALGSLVDQTRGLYLLSVSSEKDRLLLKGEATTVESIAGFITALKHSGTFADVELRQYYQDDQAERVRFKFDLGCAYGQAVSAPAAGGSRLAAATGAPRARS